MALSTDLANWRERGRLVDVFGHRVFVVDQPAATDHPADADTLLLLHGYPSSSHDFVDALATLRRRFRVVVHDHIGFGLSDKPRDYSYSLIEQADAALELWRRLGIDAGHLIAHDYGTSVATELVARRQRGGIDVDLKTVTLCNGSPHVELAEMSKLQRILPLPLVGPAAARLATRWMFGRQIRRILGDAAAVDDRQLDVMWEGLVLGDGRRIIPKIARYQHERHTFWQRWIGALRRLDRPSHVLWGRQDAVAVADIARTLAAEIPGAELTWLDAVGHYPMLEAPERWTAAVMAFLPDDSP